MSRETAEKPNRIAEMRMQFGLTQSQLAELAGMSVPQLVKLERGERRLTLDWMKKIAQGLSAAPGASDIVEPAELISRGISLGMPAATPKLRSVTESTLEFGGRQYIPLPVYDLRASAGPGAMNADHAEPVYHHLYSVESLRNVSRLAFDMLALVRISGDSMAPTLQNGDIVLVERTDRGIGRDGLYVFAADHDVQVKRVSRDPRDRSLTISSDNPAYPTWTGVSDENVYVLGRVIALQRELGG